MLDFGPGSFFLSPSQLADSPSSRHGIPSSTEKALRLFACEIIQEACILLRLSQAVSATAQVLLHRYFCKQSFRDFDARIVAASCFWLSMKLEEEDGATYRKSKPSMLNDVVSMFDHIRARREGGVALPIHSPEFKRRKEEILKQEARVLSELGFVCNVEHPHKLLLGYLTCLGASKELVQESWNLVNDSLRTTLCVSYPSNVVASGVIFAAARRLSIPLPESPAWWAVFDATFEQILDVCNTLADLYRQPKSQFISVNKVDSFAVSALSSRASTRYSEPQQQICGQLSNKKTLDDNLMPVHSSSSASTILNVSFVHAPGSSLPELVAHKSQHEERNTESLVDVSKGVSIVTNALKLDRNRSSCLSVAEISSDILIQAEMKRCSVDSRSSDGSSSRNKQHIEEKNKRHRSQIKESEERYHKRQCRDSVERYERSWSRSSQSKSNSYGDWTSTSRYSRDDIGYGRDGRCSSRYKNDRKYYSTQHSKRVKA